MKRQTYERLAIVGTVLTLATTFLSLNYGSVGGIAAALVLGVAAGYTKRRADQMPV